MGRNSTDARTTRSAKKRQTMRTQTLQTNTATLPISILSNNSFLSLFMRKICLPRWLVILVSLVIVTGAFYGTYRYGWTKGDNSYACMPDVNFDEYYMQCYRAAFASGVMCPCSRDLDSVHTCLDILDNKAFGQSEKQAKVEAAFGKEWSQLIPVQPEQIVDCREQGLCPKGTCVTWEGACHEEHKVTGQSQDACCLAVIPTGL